MVTAPVSHSSPPPPPSRPEAPALTSQPRPHRGSAHQALSPAVLSLSRIRKDPCVFPGAKSCRSASLRLRFLKNQLYKADTRPSTFDRFFFFFWCSPSCPGTPSVHQTGLQLRDLPAPPSRMLGLKACATFVQFFLHPSQTSPTPRTTPCSEIPGCEPHSHGGLLLTVQAPGCLLSPRS